MMMGLLARWCVRPFLTHSLFIDVCQVVAGVLVVVTSVAKGSVWSPYEKGGETFVSRLAWCPSEKTTCGTPTDGIQVAALVASRFSAGSMYAVLFLSCATTMHSSATWLGRRARVRLNGGLFGGQSRDVHVRAGKVFGRLALVHAACHYLRWAKRGQLKQTSKVPMVILGVVSFVALCSVHPLTTFVRRKVHISFETSMIYFHHLFVFVGVVFGCAHHPRLARVSTVLILLWLLDRLHLVFFRSYVIESPHLAVCGKKEGGSGGVLVTFRNPAQLNFETGDYVRVRFPWMAGAHGREYHPFSIAPISAGKTFSERSMLYLQVEGDWTKAVKDHVLRRGNGTARPMLVVGPFASPFSTSFMHEYLLLVASGIGITPSLSVLSRLGKTRHVCVLWICRDLELVRLYSDYLDTECGLCDAAIVHVTGPDQFDLPTDLAITAKAGRPDVKTVTRRILTGGNGSFDHHHNFFEPGACCANKSADCPSYDDVITDTQVDMENNIKDERTTFRDSIESLVATPLPAPPQPPPPPLLPNNNSNDHNKAGNAAAGNKHFPSLKNFFLQKRCATKGPFRISETDSRTSSLDSEFQPTQNKHHENLGEKNLGKTIKKKQQTRSPLPRLHSHQWHSQRCFKEQPVAGPEWKVLYCGGSIEILRSIESICKEEGASFESEVFQDTLR